MASDPTELQRIRAEVGMLRQELRRISTKGLRADVADLGSRLGVLENMASEAYTPQLTAVTSDPSLGSGGNFQQFGRYIRVGQLVFVWVRLRFGSTGVSAGSGAYMVSLPFPVASFYVTGTGVGAGPAIGVGHMRDHSASTASVPLTIQPFTDLERVLLNFFQPSGNAAVVAGGTPFTVATDDVISFQATYLTEAA